MERVIYVLTGCTAVGKTELALRWAEENGAEIVSCDSLLFYRGMDIGTAKPSREEQARAPHHLIDIRDVRQQMDIARYVALARAAVDAIFARQRRVLVTGGSGFYLKTFFSVVADEVEVPDEIRARVRSLIENAGLEAAVAELRVLNPEGLGALDTANPRRVVRALERCRTTGRTLAQMRAEFAAQPAPFGDCEVRLCELVREKEDLEARIEERVGAMLRRGLIEEVRDLLAAGLKENSSAARAIGYRETVDFLEGRLARDELAPAIMRNTRGLVKKQRTWFKTQLPPHPVRSAVTAKLRELFAGGD